MRIMLAYILLFIAFSVNAQKAARHVENGNGYYQQKEFAKAKDEYDKALQKDKTDAVAQFNSGNASHQLKKYEEASKSYEAAAAATGDPALKAQALYNQGLSYIRQNKLPEAIEAFKRSLRLNPDDTDARENLQKALKELKQQQQKSSDKQNDKNKKKPKDKDQPQTPKTKLSKEEAEKLLNDLQKEEKNLQKQVQKKNQSARQLKDW
jgi:Ca-activated chloride channel family protein